MSHTRGMSRDPRGRRATPVGERFSGFPSRDACGAGEYGLQTSTRRGVDPPGSLAKPTIKFHNIRFATHICRRQIEKSPLAQIEMSLSTVLVGEFWADDGDYDEPDGDRPDERVAGSGCGQAQSNGSRDADGPWRASGVPIGQGLQPARR